ncbi:RidA family protein [Amycolatopsis jejuensis]|uniref:RidA family protein n=1 Tax=Amycolatopsis jejuensis TaxID=330084 RepID=UPI0005240C3A|nr:RidA family protein [Amycolatopsis jejuensis]
MPKHEVISPDLAAPNGHFSQATRTTAEGTLVFISGMTARRADGTVAGIGDIAGQTRQVCRNLEAAVQAAGGTLDDIVRLDVYVTDIRHFDEIHAVRREFFTGVAPASTMVEVSKFVRPEYLIEINAIAVVR